MAESSDAYKYALKIHGLPGSALSDSDSNCSDLEEYEQFRPPSVKISEDKLVTITPKNCWQKIPNVSTNSDQDKTTLPHKPTHQNDNAIHDLPQKSSSNKKPQNASQLRKASKNSVNSNVNQSPQNVCQISKSSQNSVNSTDNQRLQNVSQITKSSQNSVNSTNNQIPQNIRQIPTASPNLMYQNYNASPHIPQNNIFLTGSQPPQNVNQMSMAPNFNQSINFNNYNYVPPTSAHVNFQKDTSVNSNYNFTFPDYVSLSPRTADILQILKSNNVQQNFPNPNYPINPNYTKYLVTIEELVTAIVVALLFNNDIQKSSLEIFKIDADASNIEDKFKTVFRETMTVLQIIPSNDLFKNLFFKTHELLIPKINQSLKSSTSVSAVEFTQKCPNSQKQNENTFKNTIDTEFPTLSESFRKFKSTSDNQTNAIAKPSETKVQSINEDTVVKCATKSAGTGAIPRKKRQRKRKSKHKTETVLSDTDSNNPLLIAIQRAKSDCKNTKENSIGCFEDIPKANGEHILHVNKYYANGEHPMAVTENCANVKETDEISVKNVDREGDIRCFEDISGITKDQSINPNSERLNNIQDINLEDKCINNSQPEYDNLNDNKTQNGAAYDETFPDNLDDILDKLLGYLIFCVLTGFSALHQYILSLNKYKTINNSLKSGYSFEENSITDSTRGNADTYDICNNLVIKSNEEKSEFKFLIVLFMAILLIFSFGDWVLANSLNIFVLISLKFFLK